MEDWPAPKWGHPLPKASKYLRSRAFIWLSLVVVITGISLFVSYIRTNKSIDKDALITFPDYVIFPFTSEFKAKAYHLASTIERDAKAISLSYRLAEPEAKKIRYHPILVFCSPENPAWFLEMDIQVNRSAFFRNHYQARTLKPAEASQYDCSVDNVGTPSTTAPEAFLIAQRFVVSNYPPEDFKWPDEVHLVKDPTRGYSWEFTYDGFFSESNQLVLAVKSGSGTVTEK
jgi:hypothetical protein